MKVTVSYSLKAPFGGDFSDQYAPRPDVGVIFEKDVDEKSTDFQTVADELYDLAKMHVHAQMGIPSEKVDGVLQPVFTIQDIPATVPPSRKPTSKPAPSGNLPTVIIDGVEYVDYRNSTNKQANPRFPDFKTADNNSSEWLYGKNGETTAFYEKAMAAGVL